MTDDKNITQADVDAFKQFVNSAEWQAFVTQFAAWTQQACEAMVALLKDHLEELSAALQEQDEGVEDD